MSPASFHAIFFIACVAVVGIGVGMTFGVWLGISASAAVWALAPQVNL